MDKLEALGAVWPKGEEKVADRQGDAVTKGNCLFIGNPAPFSHNLSHNRAADARFCSASSGLTRRENALLQRTAHSGFVYHSEGFVSGSSDFCL